MMRLLLLTLSAASCSSLVLPHAVVSRAALPTPRVGDVRAGFFDMFQESEAQKAVKEAQWREQQEIMARRRNPAAQEAYFKEVEANRAKASAANAELKQLQKGGGGDGDVLEDWKKLKEEGKVVASEQERDADSARMGSAGLIAERIDEKLPYIDSGYVDEDAPDLMEGLKKLFGGDKK